MLFQGSSTDLSQRRSAMQSIPVDQACPVPAAWAPAVCQTTLCSAVTVEGPATYHKGRKTALTFRPTDMEGWWIRRTDQPEQLPVRVFTGNVWTAQRSIVLRSGSEHNYLRMSEHIIAQRLGLGLDNVILETETGDPPLFDVGSMPLVNAIQQAGLCQQPSRPVIYKTVREPVAILGPHGGFLEFLPAENGDRRLTLDVAIDFPTAIGQQRIQFVLTPETFTFGAHARTNCSRKEMWLAKTIGKFFADIRNLGYTHENILVAGKARYVTTPRPELMVQGKSLEAVWHRACLDLIAALSLIDTGRLCGAIRSFKAGHALDCKFMNLLYIHHLLTEC